LLSGVICSSCRTAPLKRSTHAGNDGNIAGRRWAGSRIGSIFVTSVAISASVLGCSPYPVSPCSIPIKLHASAAGLLLPVIFEFFEFGRRELLANEIVSDCHVGRLRLPIVRQARPTSRSFLFLACWLIG
jgi:predicted alpha/beta-hydrolase family hydrolase